MQPNNNIQKNLAKSKNSIHETSKEKIELWSTQNIEFSQASVAATFTDGSSINDLTQKLLSSQIDVTNIPPIRIVKFGSRWITLDNRRLRAFKDAFALQIPVKICSLMNEQIKKEFFAKKTNKSLTEGGSIRLSSGNSSQHFEEGTFIFTKQVLNWTFEQLSMTYPGLKYCQPLPAQFMNANHYYKGFLDLILEETRASLEAGIEASKKGAAEVLEFLLCDLKKSKKAQNPSVITFIKCAEDNIFVKPNDAYILEYGSDKSTGNLQLLALATYATNEESRKVSFKVVLDEGQISNLPQALTKQSKWKGKSIGSVVTHLRMYDVCTAAPEVAWLPELLTGKLTGQSKSAAVVVSTQPIAPPPSIFF